ncbi:DeoR family transcriptional regulator [Thermodesulfobacteriota bacterium]
MDDNQVLERFRRQKIVTIEQLVNWLKCSVMTVRRRLKKWRGFTSINQNGRYYTLPQTPVFDQNGLWRYQRVLFSKHGNLKQTIVTLITDSAKGLSAVEIARLVDLAPNSSFISRIKEVSGVKREKHQGRFVYFSEQPKIYSLQKYALASGRQAADVPTDQEAVMILVELIKHPGIVIEQLAARVSKQGQWIEPATVRAFLESHDLIKKTADIKR